MLKQKMVWRAVRLCKGMVVNGLLCCSEASRPPYVWIGLWCEVLDVICGWSAIFSWCECVFGGEISQYA